MADTAYDADPLRQAIAAKGAIAVIPNNPSRALKYPLDRHLYAQRHLVDLLCGCLTGFPPRLNVADVVSLHSRPSPKFCEPARSFARSAINFCLPEFSSDPHVPPFLPHRCPLSRTPIPPFPFLLNILPIPPNLTPFCPCSICAGFPRISRPSRPLHRPLPRLIRADERNRPAAPKLTLPALPPPCPLGPSPPSHSHPPRHPLLFPPLLSSSVVSQNSSNSAVLQPASKRPHELPRSRNPRSHHPMDAISVHTT